MTVIDLRATDLSTAEDLLMSLESAPLTARILDRLTFIMATAEEVSLMIDQPGADEEVVSELTDVLQSVYAQTDELMRLLAS